MKALKAAALLLLASPLMAFVVRPLTPEERALVQHATNNDPAWGTLADTAVSEDKDKGLLLARFGPAVSRLKGADFEISGFMTPLETALQTRHFILTRRDTTCPFCPPNRPTEAVEVELDRPMAFTRDEVRVEGRLQLNASSEASLFYRLTGAKAALDPAYGGRS